MRRLLILVILSLLMAGLNLFEVQADGVVEPKSLAALGFVLLVAFIMGEFAAVAKLPRVTGYLVTGVLSGPSIANFFSAEVVDELSMMNSLAVGLIALTAGGELRVADLLKNARSIAFIIGLQVLIIFPLVTLAFGFVAPQLFDFTIVGPVGSSIAFLLALGAMFGALAVGNSPAVSVAIVNDTGSKGPFTNLNLGVTITKDLVVVVLFSVVTAISLSSMNPAGSDLGAAMLFLAKEIGLSVGVGTVLGFGLVAYLRWVNKEVMLFLVGIIFVGMWVGDVLHLEKILEFLVAGFIVENFSKHGHDMIHHIERVSPPVYVVFFAVAGASLDLSAIAQMIVISGLVVGFRVFGMLVSTNIGARLSGLAPLYQRSLGIGFFSQAGVTLGLVLIAAPKLDLIPLEGTELLLGSDIFVPMMMGVVAINLLAGPVFLKLSFAASGETAEQRGASVDERHESPEVHDPHSHAPPEPEVEEEGPLPEMDEVSQLPPEPETPVGWLGPRPSEMLPPPPRMPVADLPDVDLGPELDRALRVVREGLEDAIQNFRWDFVEPQRADAQLVIEQLRDRSRTIFDELVSRTANVSDVESMRQWLRRARVNLAEVFYSTLLAERGEEQNTEFDDSAFSKLWTKIQDIPDDLPKALAVDEYPELFEPSDQDGLILSIRKNLSRKRSKMTGLGQRVVPLRRLIEFHVSGPFPPNAVPIANMAGHQRFYFWRKVGITTRFIDRQMCALLQELDDPLLVEPKHDLLPLGQLPDPDEGESDTARQRRLGIAVKGIRERLPGLVEDMSGEFKFVVDDLNTYADELVGRLGNVVVASFSDLVASARIAGTYQLPDRRINTSKVYDQYRTGVEEIRTALRRWRTASLGYSGRQLAVLDIIDLQHIAFGRIAEAQIEVANALLNDLRPVPSTLADRVRAALSQITHALGGEAELDASTALPIVEAVRIRLHDEINAAIERLESRRDRGRFQDLLTEFTNHLASDCTQLTSIYDVLEIDADELQESRTPRELTLKTLPLRDLARELLSGEVAVKLSAVNGIVSATVEMAISGLSDIQRVVSFNLDAATSELHTYQQQTGDDVDEAALAREFALGALQRSLDRLQEMLLSIDQAELHVGEMIESQTLNQLQRMRRMAVEGNVSSIRAYLTQRHLEERGQEAASGLRGFVKRSRERGTDLYARWVQPTIATVRDRLARKLGIEAPLDRPIIEVTDIASFEALQRASAMPITYRRLFTPAPVEVDEFFTSRSKETADFVAAYQRFERGLTTSVLIHAEYGSGKTSFVDHALAQLNTELPVERMAFSHNFGSERQLAVQLGDLLDQQTRDLNRLRARLRNAKTRRIVVIEGLDNFYLRTLDGFEALQRFLLLVSETSHVFFWVVTVGDDAFRYLQSATSLRDHFTHEIPLQRLSVASLQRLIEARHNVSGYDLRFLHKLNHEPDRPSLFGEPSQQQLQAEFFDKLATHSSGNITLALYYWLSSLHGMSEDQKTIDVRPLQPLETRFIAEMALEAQLALGVVIAHGGLSVPDFSRVFRVTQDRARSLLTRLVNLNLLHVEPGHVDTYRVNPVFYRPIADVLRERHIL